MVAVVQYLRVALITASMPVVVALVYHADKTHHAAARTQTDSAPWYLSIAMIVVLVVVGAVGGRLIRLPGAGLLGPLALTVCCRSPASRSAGGAGGAGAGRYMLIGWQAGVAFTRESLRTIGRCCPPRWV